MAVKRFTRTKKRKHVKKTYKMRGGAGKTGKPGKQKAKTLMETYSSNINKITKSRIDTNTAKHVYDTRPLLTKEEQLKHDASIKKYNEQLKTEKDPEKIKSIQNYKVHYMNQYYAHVKQKMADQNAVIAYSKKKNNQNYGNYLEKYTPDVMKELQKMSMTTKLQRMRNIFRSSQNRAAKEKERQKAGEIYRAISTSRNINAREREKDTDASMIWSN